MAPASRSTVCIGAAALAVAVLVAPCPAAAQRGWTGAAVDLSMPAESTSAPEVAVDAGGHVTAAWVRATLPSGFVVEAARYSPSAGTWSAPVPLSPPGLPGADVAVAADPTGGALAVWATDGGIYVSRYLTVSQEWTPALLVASRQYAHEPDVAVDVQGNAFASWHLDTGEPSEVARYSATAATWSAAVPLSPGGTPRLAVDGAGNAHALWVNPYNAWSSVMVAARYSTQAQAWTTALPLDPPRTTVAPARIATDGAGNAIAVWVSSYMHSYYVVAARFDAATGVWASATILGGGLPVRPFSLPDLVVRANGEAVAVWGYEGRIEISRYTSPADTWSAREAITPDWPSPYARGPRLGMDALGNVTVAWQVDDGRVQAARLAQVGLASPLWAGPVDLCTSCDAVAVAAAPLGDATVVSRATAGANSLLRSSRWDATPNAPDITDVSPSPGALSVQYSTPQTSEPAFLPINYEYSLDDGASWIAQSPPSNYPPLVISGLNTAVPYSLRLRAVNGAGAGAPSSRVVVVADAAPHPPADFAVRALAGNTVTFSWRAPPRSQYETTGYLLEGGVLPGQVLASIPATETATTLTLTAPSGVFFVRLHTLSRGPFGKPLRSLASNEIRLVVNVPELPTPPAHLLGLVTGSDLALSWTPTFGGGAPTNHLLNVSGALSASLPLPAGETFAFSGVPSGTYTLSVSARNGAGVSAPSNAVTLTFPAPCSGVPGPPQRLQASLAGRTITLMWDPPETGAAATGYEVRVVGSFLGAFPVASRVLSGTVGPGDYLLSAVATNPCGVSAPSASVTVVVP